MLPQLFKRFRAGLMLLLIIGLLIRLMRMKLNDQISENFKFSEFDAPADAKIRSNIKKLVLNVLQPLRNSINMPIVITSGYRNTEKNNSVGGVKNSAHLTGSAVDFVVRGATLTEVFNTIQALKLPFDELILYREGSRSASGHIHVSHTEKNRGKVIITESNYRRQ